MAQKTGTLTLTLVGRDDGATLTSADIANYLLEEKPHAGTSWAQVYTGTDLSPKTVNGMTGGLWDFRATCKDAKGGPDGVATTTLTVPVGAIVVALAGTVA